MKVSKILLGSIILMFLMATLAQAQYFGQNRVRFKPLDFEVLKTQHFDIHYYPEEREAAQIVGRMAERWYVRLSRLLNHELPPAQPIILYDSHPAFRQTTALPGEIGVGTGGVTEGLKRRVILPMGASLGETDHVLGHELVHAFQYDMTSRPGDALSGGEPGAAGLPLWFVEGMAEYLTLGALDPNTAMWLRDSVQHEKVPRLKDFEKPDYFPYRFGQAFWAFTAGSFGDDIIGRMLVAAGRGSPEQAIRSVLKVSPEQIDRDWQEALSEQYGEIQERGHMYSLVSIGDDLVKAIYWHKELPPLDGEVMGEHVVEATSNRVSEAIDHQSELWHQSYATLMDHARTRIEQEIPRLGGHYAHVLDEHIESHRNDATGESWLHGRFNYVLFRRKNL